MRPDDYDPRQPAIEAYEEERRLGNTGNLPAWDDLPGGVKLALIAVFYNGRAVAFKQARDDRPAIVWETPRAALKGKEG